MRRSPVPQILEDLGEINAQIRKESKEMVSLLDLVLGLDEDASNYSKIAVEFLEAGATAKADKYEKLAVEIKKKANTLRKRLEKKQGEVEALTGTRSDLLLELGHMRGSIVQ